MTRERTYLLTAIAAVLFIVLTAVFGSVDLFTSHWWDTAAYADSAIFTYILLALIVAAGLVQARQLPAEGVRLAPATAPETPGQFKDPGFWQLLTGNVYYAILWLPLRFFIGREWLTSGEAKLRSSAWMSGGTALQGYWKSATALPANGRAPITYDWYRSFLSYMLNHGWYTWFAKVIAIGEFLVGLGLLIGALVAIAAFFGTVMNFAYLLAGTASSNPVLFGLSIFIILGWKVAGYWGLDRYLLPALGVPWHPGPVFQREPRRPGGSRQSTA